MNDFTPYDGSGMPAELVGKLVEVRYKSGYVSPSLPATDYAWRHHSHEYQIDAYRIDNDPERIAFFQRNAPNAGITDA